MSENLEGMLAQAIIDSTERTHAHHMLDQMRVTTIRQKMHFAEGQVVAKDKEISDLGQKVQKSEAEIRKANLEKMNLNRQVRESMANADAQRQVAAEWMQLLRSPLSEIAKRHSGFAKNYSAEQLDHAKVYLQKLVNEYATKELALRGGYTEEQITTMKYKIEEMIITNEMAEEDYRIEKHPQLMAFHGELIDDYNVRAVKMKETVQKMNKSAKKFK